MTSSKNNFDFEMIHDILSHHQMGVPLVDGNSTQNLLDSDDIFFFGFMIGALTKNSGKHEKNYETLLAIWEQTKNLNSLVFNKVISCKEKYAIFTRLLKADHTNYEKLIYDEVQSVVLREKVGKYYYTKCIFNQSLIFFLFFFLYKENDFIYYTEAEEEKIPEDFLGNFIYNGSDSYVKSYNLQIEHEKCKNLSCPICLSPLVDSKYWRLINCGHYFHIQCLKPYLETEVIPFFFR